MSKKSNDVVITAALRTPIGTYKGSLKGLSADKLGALAIKEAVYKSKLKSEDIDEVIMGHVLTSGLGQNPARQASIHAGIPVSKPAHIINQVCGSGLRSVISGYQSIKLGENKIIVAGGQENMSRAPHAIFYREDKKLDENKLVDTMINDGLIDSFNNYHMGITAENVAEKYKISRDEQDLFALNSQEKTQKATNENRFKNELIKLKIDTDDKNFIFEKDEHRAFLEGRLNEKQLDSFRQEVKPGGLSSYPHPWLMPKFWQFPTVSMGLGPMLAIYQARYMKYLINRGLIKDEGRKVWAFLGDGEMDEPESLGAIGLASREKLDNLIFVINCNLQRLDGPVRGNGKIIQELEGSFRGAGWNVIKVIWGSYWDSLIANDKTGHLVKAMNETVDGEYQAMKARDGAYVREKFFGKYPETQELVSSLSDKDIWRLNRGGHDPHKVYAAYDQASKNQGSPTVIIAKTIKGYGMGKTGESVNTTHQTKKLDVDDLLYYRDRFDVPLTDDQVKNVEYFKPDEKSPEIKYIKERRMNLGGSLPERTTYAKPIKAPAKDIFDFMKVSTGEKEMSTTMALVRMFTNLLRDKNVSPRLVPIIPDEARTFGMEGFFQKIGIYAHEGQKYEPEDSAQLSSYREDKSGQVLEEGINEAGAMSSWIAAATAYTNHDIEMIPIYIFYSMFGFQRIGDLAWAAGDSQARGFLIGATAGRTTLAGEGLQHQDGHSHLIASTIPNCVTYDPTFHYELAVIFREGLRRMHEKNENVFYYITTMNENYSHPGMPKDKNCEEGILKGMYKIKEFNRYGKTKIQLLGSGTILREMMSAAEILQNEYQIDSEIWSVTSFNELRKDGMEVERYNLLNPDKEQKVSFVEQCLGKTEGPIMAASDYMRMNSDQIRPYTNKSFYSLGTDGYGRSDTRKNLRKFFEVDKEHIVAYGLSVLAKEQLIASKYAKEAIKKYNIDGSKPMPTKL